MDNRKSLSKGTMLPFPGMCCTVEEEIGRGSNAIVYKGIYPDFLNPEEKHIVLIKELFPLHIKGYIKRGLENEVLCEEEGQEHFELHKSSFEYGNKIHLQMLQKYPEQIGENFNTFVLNQTHYTILGFTGGRSLEQELSYEDYNLKKLVKRMIGLLDALEAFHENGLLHLDIAPDNIMLIGKGIRERVMLIDFNSTHSIESIQSKTSFYASIKAGYTASEIRSGKRNLIGFASDLYSVAAVFYRCLSGVALTPFQMLRPTPPDVSNSPFLKDVPETVLSMVKQILFCGLSSLVKKRYASVSEMRTAFEELNDRIDGVGITHWALWEAGKKEIHRLLHNNPALSYLEKEENIFPANVTAMDGMTFSMKEGMSRLFTEEENHMFLTAPGGMGKTTAMFRTMYEQAAHYSAICPAIAYVSLYGWKKESTTYIRDCILENLHFKREMTNYEDARHVLQSLLKLPLQAKNGNKYPVLVIFLDGLNEASGATQVLIEEIKELSKLEGVKLLISSRTEEVLEGFSYWKLSPLKEEEVSEIVSSRGLLLPKSNKMCELLRIPLMLSMFLETAGNKEKQLLVETQEELLQLYFSSLVEKELRDLPENTNIRWQIEVAVFYVLPALATELHKKQQNLNDAQLLLIVEKCYRLFSSFLLRNAFPKWIGHSKAIYSETWNVEQWYGLIVHDILWHRLGLLVKNEQGNYQMLHQIIEEYLLEQDRKNQKRIWKRQQIKIGIAISSIVVVLLSGGWIYKNYIAPQPYAKELAQSVLFTGNMSYTNMGKQYEEIRKLLDCAIEQPEQYVTSLNYYHSMTKYLELGLSVMELSETLLEDMLQSGEVMPWSYEVFDEENYKKLLLLEEERKIQYKEYIDILTYIMADEVSYTRYKEEYCELLDELIELDATIASVLFQMVCYRDIDLLVKEDASDKYNFESVMKGNWSQNKHLLKNMDINMLQQELLNLEGERNEVADRIRASGAFARYQKVIVQPYSSI